MAVPGKAYIRDSKLTEALEAYQQAIALQPDYTKARTELAIVLTRLNRHAEALALLEEGPRVLFLDAQR